MVGLGSVLELTSSAPTQAQTQGFELAQPSIYLIYDLLEHVKGPVLHSQSCRISTTQGNNQISKRNPSEDPEASNISR